MASPPFYSSFTPPFSSTIPPPSPNLYGYPYSSYYNHEHQLPLPCSQPQPPPPYTPTPHFHHSYSPPSPNPYTSYDPYGYHDAGSSNVYNQQPTHTDPHHVALENSFSITPTLMASQPNQELFVAVQESISDIKELLQNLLDVVRAEKQLSNSVATEVPAIVDDQSNISINVDSSVSVVKENVSVLVQASTQEVELPQAPSPLPQPMPPNANRTTTPPPKPPDMSVAPTSSLKFSSSPSLIDSDSNYCCSAYTRRLFDEMPERDASRFFAARVSLIISVPYDPGPLVTKEIDTSAEVCLMCRYMAQCRCPSHARLNNPTKSPLPKQPDWNLSEEEHPPPPPEPPDLYCIRFYPTQIYPLCHVLSYMGILEKIYACHFDLFLFKRVGEHYNIRSCLSRLTQNNGFYLLPNNTGFAFNFLASWIFLG